MMNKDTLLQALRALQDNDDYEVAHGEADNLLVEYINDPEIAEAYAKIGKWYA